MGLIKEINLDPPLSGIQNMERDKNNFFRFNESDLSGFIIRFYEWIGPTISLGISQKEDFLIEHPDISVVKRISGGKAVLHHNEITYSIVSDYENNFFGGGLSESYGKVSNLLLGFFAKKLPQVRVKQVDLAERSVSPICYSAKGFKEICLDGKKFIGSAQKRGKRAFLQHGSIPIIRHGIILENYIKGIAQKTELNNDKPTNNYVFLNDFIPSVTISETKIEMKNYFAKALL